MYVRFFILLSWKKKLNLIWIGKNWGWLVVDWDYFFNVKLFILDVSKIYCMCLGVEISYGGNE